MDSKEQKEYFKDGTLSGTYHVDHEGKKHGACEFFYKNGTLKAKGQFKSDEFAGEWYWNRENGQPLQQGVFVEGKQHGPWRRYHDNGQLMDEGEWNMGKRTGEWKFYNKDGLLRKLQVFK